MVELMGMGVAALAGTAAFVVVLLPRKWLVPTVLAALFVPLLAICASMIGSRIAFGSFSGEVGNAVGELDLWLLGLALYATVAAVFCLGRVLVSVKHIAAPPSRRLLDR